MTIAILAHDSRKELALQFCTAYSGILSRNTVIATGTTGRMLAQATGLPVHCYLSGRLGGIQQIAARVACDEVDLVLFFRDPLKQETGSSNEQNLLRLCDMHSVPISTTSPRPRCCCAASIRATSIIVMASTPTSRSLCPSTGPCAEAVFFETSTHLVFFVYRGFRITKDTAEVCASAVSFHFILCSGSTEGRLIPDRPSA